MTRQEKEQNEPSPLCVCVCVYVCACVRVCVCVCVRACVGIKRGRGPYAEESCAGHAAGRLLPKAQEKERTVSAAAEKADEQKAPRLLCVHACVHVCVHAKAERRKRREKLKRVRLCCFAFALSASLVTFSRPSRVALSLSLSLSFSSFPSLAQWRFPYMPQERRRRRRRRRREKRQSTLAFLSYYGSHTHPKTRFCIPSHTHTRIHTHTHTDTCLRTAGEQRKASTHHKAVKKLKRERERERERERGSVCVCVCGEKEREKEGVLDQRGLISLCGSEY